MRYKIYYLEKASNDLESILDFIAQDSLQRANDYIQSLYLSIGNLADFPKLGTTCKRKHIRRNCRVLIIENYLVFYKIDEISQSIFVGRVLHRSINYKNTILF